VLLFVLQFVPLFAICLWLFPRALPAYQQVVVRGANVGLARLDPAMRLVVTDDGGWRAFVVRPDGSEEYYWYRPGTYLVLVYLGLPLLPPLLLATPLPLSQRLLRLGIGMLLLLLTHMVAGFVLVWSIRCLADTPESTTCMALKTLVNDYGQFMTFVLWGLLAWDAWLPRAEHES
jgi:hypothetical protein